MVLINGALFLLSMLYFMTSHADFILEPKIQPGTTFFTREHTTILWITLALGVIVLVLVGYFMRKK